MSQPLKIIYGLSAFLPIILLLIQIYSILQFITGSFEGNITLSEQEVSMQNNLNIIFGLALITVVNMIAYLIHIFQNKRIKKDNRYLWAIIVLFANIIVFPVYWYVHILNGEK
jgi:hypothetical protein